MEKVYRFIKDECAGVFHLLTVRDGFPVGRPFGALAYIGETLYVTTGPHKGVYRDMIAKPQVGLVVIKPGARDWVRVNAVAEETQDLAVKAEMLAQCPNLLKYHPVAEDPTFAVFALKSAVADWPKKK